MSLRLSASLRLTAAFGPAFGISTGIGLRASTRRARAGASARAARAAPTAAQVAGAARVVRRQRYHVLLDPEQHVAVAIPRAALLL